MTEYRITRLGYQGDGVTDGPLFVSGALPGEIVTGVPDGNRLTDIRIQTPSSDRVSPPCRHFKSCGGCQLQHASDEFVAAWKTDVVATALSAYGIEPRFLPISTSPPQSRRRAGFTARRTKKAAMAGFHAKASETVIDIPECKLLHPDLMAGLPVARALAEVGASRKNGISVAATLTENGLDLFVTGGKPLDGPLRIELARLADAHDLARLAWDDEVVVTRRPPDHGFGAANVQPPPGAFLQATAEGQATLTDHVREITQGAHRIVDLFSGCGTFSLPLAQDAEVHAVEGDADMIAALDAGWRHAEGLKAVTHEVRDLFRRPLMPDELAKFDAAVIDPPRAGAQAQTNELCEARISRIAYVSCNPTSFARDANALVSSGYSLGAVRVVDQFRWSTHIELVAEFSITSG